MIEVFLITLFAFLLITAAMAIGAIVKGKCLSGTCGGLNAMFGKGSCEACEHKNVCLDKDKEKDKEKKS
ncbi:MAG: (Na+)-NQR maturation NqrM [Halobacteriovoraceae bacterium]|nr:(Na+)-NQR maturation NqrM [Halobacteriovoraceae bacterium]MCB9094066.1 (Na+)-NQR maturation NqrM [Halobacteriovoraceae bacterium]